MGIKLLHILLILFCTSCSTSQDDKGFTGIDGGDSDNGATAIVLPEFDRNYEYLESASAVKDRNFYWATLVENTPSVSMQIENDDYLSGFLTQVEKRLADLLNQTNVSATAYANALRFSDDERLAISGAIKNVVEKNAEGFVEFSNAHLGPSGAFNHFQEVTDVARLNQLIVEEMMLGINQIIDTYVAGIDPIYPELDRVSYDVNSEDYKTLLKNLVHDLNSKKAYYTLFYQPFLDFALGALKLNNRDEAARFVPLHLGENAPAYEAIKSVSWQDYQYSLLVVLGDAPNSSGDLPNISLGGMERCDYAVTLFNKGMAPFIAFTGANVAPFQSQYHEAIEMKKYVMDKYGIAEDKILVDPHARHTTTNLRNIGRLIFRYGIPDTKKALLSTSQSQSNYVSSNQFATRCLTQMGHLPMELNDRLTDRDLEFTPTIKVLHLDSSDPLDP
ncbi:YdcF family protein [Aestuariivivens sediminis]|uniref:YdcF family protein n=1 Tax=Aestuariivivens sediminis TaxID=2913557 RepID=UPI001F57B72C|nr:YdcF family protein [Aestuariivivens sediminis]